MEPDDLLRQGRVYPVLFRGRCCSPSLFEFSDNDLDLSRDIVRIDFGRRRRMGDVDSPDLDRIAAYLRRRHGDRLMWSAVQNKTVAIASGCVILQSVQDRLSAYLRDGD